MRLDETSADEGATDGRHGRRLSRLLIVGSLAAILAAATVYVTLPTLTSSAAEAVPGQDSVDAGFARDMAVHHQQAVELSFIVRDRTDDEDVRRLAYDVINTQANQRGMLLGWLDAWGLSKSSQQPPMSWMDHTANSVDGMEVMDYRAHDGSLMPGMATNTQMDQLRTAGGKDAEVRYLRLLYAHHKGGIGMAQAAADTADKAEVARLAESIVQGQKSEMKLMADMLAQRGATV
ncbi:DUF305 domain-containing protein [Streptomyces sp. NPDC006349]|uniref:DUF305 domain-containing protein n=1 Tax=Streptomyces sp. NPDC006349 TaxID=3156757 RepID=UPI0006B9654E|nr:hypothetical protein ADL35_32730 [Streptomyces sp. NRRL WC-3753]